MHCMEQEQKEEEASKKQKGSREEAKKRKSNQIPIIESFDLTASLIERMNERMNPFNAKKNESEGKPTNATFSPFFLVSFVFSWTKFRIPRPLLQAVSFNFPFTAFQFYTTAWLSLFLSARALKRHLPSFHSQETKRKKTLVSYAGPHPLPVFCRTPSHALFFSLSLVSLVQRNSRPGSPSFHVTPSIPFHSLQCTHSLTLAMKMSRVCRKEKTDTHGFSYQSISRTNKQNRHQDANIQGLLVQPCIQVFLFIVRGVNFGAFVLPLLFGWLACQQCDKSSSFLRTRLQTTKAKSASIHPSIISERNDQPVD